jgi:hypothetical protein
MKLTPRLIALACLVFAAASVYLALTDNAGWLVGLSCGVSGAVGFGLWATGYRKE